MLESSASHEVRNFRLRRFFHAVASGYAQLVANVLYVLASVPLALHFLEKREFGLWALAVQLGGYLQLIDFGMSASVSRHLIDHKDGPETGDYGALIKTGGLVLFVQGLLVLTGGALLVSYGTSFLHIDPDLDRPFKIVMVFQCALIAADFPARLFGHVLTAHQRVDIANYSQIGGFLSAYLVLWFCFAHGYGIYSLVWASATIWLISALSNTAACFALNFFPARHAWGLVSWSMFRELFVFGKDVFWIALGTQMINASQAIVVTRTLGLSAAAVWAVCTRTYVLANQLVWRPFDFSGPMLSEMVARHEQQRLLYRFKGLVVLTTSLAVVAGVTFSLCNGPFVALWTHGKIAWSIREDVLLSIWMVILALVHCHSGLVLITKRIGFMRYIYFVEGIAFLGIGSFAAARYGFVGLLATSILCSLAFSFSYGIWRSAHEFNLPIKQVALWTAPSFRLLLFLIFIAVLLHPFTRSLEPKLQLAIYAVTIGIASLLLIRTGLGPESWDELRERVPRAVSRFLKKLSPA